MHDTLPISMFDNGIELLKITSCVICMFDNEISLEFIANEIPVGLSRWLIDCGIVSPAHCLDGCVPCWSTVTGWISEWMLAD